MKTDLKETRKLIPISKKYSKIPMPILECVLIKDGNIHFTDLESILIITDFLKDSPEIECLIPSTLFLELLKLLKDKPFWLHHFEDTNKFSINTQNGVFIIDSLDIDEYPDIFDITFDNQAAELTANDLNNIFEAANYCLPEGDYFHPELTGVQLNHSIYARNRKRIFEANLEANFNDQVIIPVETIKKLKALKPGSAKIFIGFNSDNKKYLKFQFENKELITRLIKQRG